MVKQPTLLRTARQKHTCNIVIMCVTNTWNYRERERKRDCIVPVAYCNRKSRVCIVGFVVRTRKERQLQDTICSAETTLQTFVYVCSRLVLYIANCSFAIKRKVSVSMRWCIASTIHMKTNKNVHTQIILRCNVSINKRRSSSLAYYTYVADKHCIDRLLHVPTTDIIVYIFSAILKKIPSACCVCALCMCVTMIVCVYDAFIHIVCLDTQEKWL